MKYQLELTEEARFDIEEAWLWYDQQKTGLGEEFLNSLEASLYQIEQNPLFFQEAYNTVRVALLRRFPYKIIFTLEGPVIGVLAVIHSRRDPTVWMVRI